MNYTRLTTLCGTPCVEVSAGGYTAYVAYAVGSNVLRLRDDTDGVEVFRYDPNNTMEDIQKSAEVWGLPSLYLPNRFADGVLKASDATYHLPVNEKAPYHNHIHGFLHKRCHTVVEHGTDESSAYVKTQYVYDENDEFFQYLPVKFRADYTFKVSAEGLDYSVTFTNLSDRKMPMSFATHTTINSPFVDGGRQEDITICVPAGVKCELNGRCLPTERLLPLEEWDVAYKAGTQCPVLQDISNDMYTAVDNTLDGKPFYGTICTDRASGKRLCYEVDEKFKFWIVWNDRGFNGYFCPEPMTAMIDAPNLSLGDDVTGYYELSPQEEYTLTQRFFVR
jgi:aldose 1-epimerase